jgi:site-specific DNA recombinase
MRAVIYCRVSTTEQAQNLSLPTQEKACREYCARHDYDVERVFVDAGESARTTDRPAFLELLAHCRRGRGQVHAVVVYSLTRFSRNTADHHAIAGGLRGLGIMLRSVTEPIDDSPTGKLMEAILAGFAQFDNDARAERVVAGLHAAVERGRWCWQAPIGYLNADARRGPSLVPDPERAPLVRKAFELYAAGVRGRDLLHQVHALGLRSKRGGARLSLSGLYGMLRQRAYISIIRPRGWTTDARGDFEPLVSVPLFERVQVGLHAKPTRTPGVAQHVDHPDFPLRRFVRCSCGGAMTGSWSTGRGQQRYAFYHCQIGCHRIPKAALESAFLALLDTLQPQPAGWRIIEHVVLASWRAAQREAKTRETAARRKIAALEQRRAKLDDAFIYQRAIDAGTYTTQRDAIDADLIVARMQAAEAFVEDIDVDGMLGFARTALAHASTLWTAAVDTQERIAVQRTFFPEGLQLRPPIADSSWNHAERTDAKAVAGASKRSRAARPIDMEPFAPPVTCLSFFELPRREGSELELVDHTVPTWNRVSAMLASLRALQAA